MMRFQNPLEYNNNYANICDLIKSQQQNLLQHLFKLSFQESIMHSTTLIALCVVMTLGMALAMYDSGSYGYSYVPYHAPQSGSGIGEGGLREYMETLSWGFPTKRDSNQSPQLQRPARKNEISLAASYI